MVLAPQSHVFTRVFDTLSHEYLQGKEEVLRLSIIALLVGGHILVEDLPGLGKTTVALALRSEEHTSELQSQR